MTIWITIGIILTFKHNIVTDEESFNAFLISRFPDELQGVLPEIRKCTDDAKMERRVRAKELLTTENKGFFISIFATIISALLPHVIPSLNFIVTWYNKLMLSDCFAAVN